MPSHNSMHAYTYNFYSKPSKPCVNIAVHNYNKQYTVVHSEGHIGVVVALHTPESCNKQVVSLVRICMNVAIYLP